MRHGFHTRVGRGDIALACKHPPPSAARRPGSLGADVTDAVGPTTPSERTGVYSSCSTATQERMETKAREGAVSILERESTPSKYERPRLPGPARSHLVRAPRLHCSP